MNPSLDSLYREYRPLLFSIAYRMTGCAADAEELVQETFVRAHQAGDTIESPKAYLTTVITRLSLDHLKSAAVKRTDYVGPWLPEPLPPGRDAADPDSLSVAFLLILETMAPLERAVFLLREVFDYDFSDIAAITEKSETNVRQIFHRAKAHVRERRPRFDASSASGRAVMERFMHACQSGDMTELLAVLAPDVRFVADSGGKVLAALNPVDGADRVARMMIGLVNKQREQQLAASSVELNGAPALRVTLGGHLAGGMIFDVVEGVIRAIYYIANPDKLSAMKQ